MEPENENIEELNENENIEELNENEVNLLIYSRDPISVTELYKIIGL